MKYHHYHHRHHHWIVIIIMMILRKSSNITGSTVFLTQYRNHKWGHPSLTAKQYERLIASNILPKLINIIMFVFQWSLKTSEIITQYNKFRSSLVHNAYNPNMVWNCLRQIIEYAQRQSLWFAVHNVLPIWNEIVVFWVLRFSY
jgi:hypothetical protein